MLGRRLILALTLGLTLGASTGDAHAAFDIDGQRQSSLRTPAATIKLRDTFAANLIRLAGYGDQCTAYALDRMHEATGQWMAVRGNAYEWADEARQAGWSVGKRPMPRSVIVMPPAPGYRYTIHDGIHGTYETPMHAYGHVGWVELVEGDWALVKDQNWRRGEIGERWVLVKDSPMQFIYSR